ncbi:restriction endonuclease subunit S [Vibrio cyclitrophicus]
MVPNEWGYKKLGVVAELQRGFDLPSAKRLEGTVPIISSGGLSGYHNEAKVKAPGIVTGRYGSIGDVFFVQDDFWPLNTSLWVKNFHGNEPKFIYYLLTSFDFKKFSDKTGVPGVNRNDLHAVKVGVPPLPEQRKIAKILSTWDKAIATTEKLVETSKQQKKALMQQLLMGKKRLVKSNASRSVREGFALSKIGDIPDDWEVELISKHYWYQEGPGVRKHQFTESGVKLFNGTNIQQSRIDISNTSTYISSEEAYGAYSHFLADSGDLVIACSGISVERFDEKIAFIKEAHLPLCMNTSTMRFKVKSETRACLTFMRYFMMSDLFKNQIRRQITGSAQLNFGPSHIAKCFVPLPSLDEQKKIASVLSCVDKEVDILEAKLSHIKQEKKALMQQLLTGKRRVKVAETE